MDLNITIKKKINIGLYAYYFALMLFFISKVVFYGIAWNISIIRYTTIICNILLILVNGLLIFKFFLDFFINIKQSFLAIGILVLLYASYINTHDNTLLYVAVFVLLGRDCCFKKIIKLYMNTGMLCLLIIIISNLLGLTSDKIVVFEYGIGHSLGMAHPNNLASLILNISLLWAFLNQEKKLFTVTVVFIFISIVTFAITYSRTTLIISFSFMILIYLYKLLKFIKIQWVFKLIKLSIISVFVVSIYLMDLSKSVEHSNFIVRFTMARDLYDEYGIRLFGNNIKFIGVQQAAELGESPVVLDNAYMNLLIYHGVVPTILFCFGIIYLLKKTSQKNDYIFMIVILLFLIVGFMEKSVFILQYNYTLICILSYDFKNKKKYGVYLIK